MSNITLNDTESNSCVLPLDHGVAMIILNIISSIFGSIGNTLICATVYTTTGLQTISNYFLVSMAVADFMVTILAQPLLAAFIGARVEGSCADTVELLFRMVSNMSCAVSVIHLCLISLDRCLMVTRPHSFSKILTKAKFRFMLICSWSLPIIYVVLRLTVSKRATSFFTVIVMALCYVIIVVSYALIIVQVHKQRNIMRSRMRQGHANKRLTRDEVERRVAMTIAIVIIIFTISWFPIIFLRSQSGEKNYGTAYNWARTLALCNSAMNPWIYCFRIPEFRAAYKRLFLKCSWGTVKGRGGPEFDTSQTSDPETQTMYIAKNNQVELTGKGMKRDDQCPQDVQV